MMAIRINLLPHRANSLIRRTRRFQLMLIATVGGALSALLLSDVLLAHQHQAQQHLLHLLRSEHDAVDQLIGAVQITQKKIDLLGQRHRRLEALHQQRNDAVRLLSWLAHNQPQDIRLQTLTQDGNHIALTGVAASHRDITELMEHLRASEDLFRQPELHEVRATDATASGPGQRFAMGVSYLPGIHPPAERDMIRP